MKHLHAICSNSQTANGCKQSESNNTIKHVYWKYSIETKYATVGYHKIPLFFSVVYIFWVRLLNEQYTDEKKNTSIRPVTKRVTNRKTTLI